MNENLKMAVELLKDADSIIKAAKKLIKQEGFNVSQESYDFTIQLFGKGSTKELAKSAGVESKHKVDEKYEAEYIELGNIRILNID